VYVLPIPTAKLDVLKAQLGTAVMALVPHITLAETTTDGAFPMALVLIAAIIVQTCALLINWTTFTICVRHVPQILNLLPDPQ
jgi:hypothetical protein